MFARLSCWCSRCDDAPAVPKMFSELTFEHSHTTERSCRRAHQHAQTDRYGTLLFRRFLKSVCVFCPVECARPPALYTSCTIPIHLYTSNFLYTVLARAQRFSCAPLTFSLLLLPAPRRCGLSRRRDSCFHDVSDLDCSCCSSNIYGLRGEMALLKHNLDHQDGFE